MTHSPSRLVTTEHTVTHIRGIGHQIFFSIDLSQKKALSPIKISKTSRLWSEVLLE